MKSVIRVIHKKKTGCIRVDPVVDNPGENHKRVRLYIKFKTYLALLWNIFMTIHALVIDWSKRNTKFKTLLLVIK